MEKTKFINVCDHWVRLDDITRISPLVSYGKDHLEFTLHRGSRGSLTFVVKEEEYQEIIEKLD